MRGSSRDERDDSGPRAARALQVDRQREHLEAERPRQRGEVGQLLDLQVLLVGAELVRLPQLGMVAGARLLGHDVEGPVDAQASMPMSFTPWPTSHAVASR